MVIVLSTTGGMGREANTFFKKFYLLSFLLNFYIGSL